MAKTEADVLKEVENLNRRGYKIVKVGQAKDIKGYDGWRYDLQNPSGYKVNEEAMSLDEAKLALDIAVPVFETQAQARQAMREREAISEKPVAEQEAFREKHGVAADAGPIEVHPDPNKKATRLYAKQVKRLQAQALLDQSAPEKAKAEKAKVVQGAPQAQVDAKAAEAKAKADRDAADAAAKAAKEAEKTAFKAAGAAGGKSDDAKAKDAANAAVQAKAEKDKAKFSA